MFCLQKLKKAEYIFLLLASIFGIILIAVIPPLGGADEVFHYQRIASIANGQILNKEVAVPGGIVDFIKFGYDYTTSLKNPPYNYNAELWQKFADIKLQTQEPKNLTPNYFTVHNPIAYIPQATVFAIGESFNFSPLSLMYMARIAGFIASVVITFYAVRIIPSQKYLLAALALLPNIALCRSLVITDTFTNALAFLLVALINREIFTQGVINKRNLLLIAITGFLLAQAKIPYLFLEFLMLAIPTARFSSLKHKIITITAIILPSIIATLAYVVLIKSTSFQGLEYHTWGGDADPDSQIAFILANPLQFTGILFNTIFNTNFAASFFEIFRSVGPGNPLSVGQMLPIFYLLCGVVACDKSGGNLRHNRFTKIIVISIIVAFIVTSLTLLYVHWTGVASTVIIGFMGRYLNPILPLLLIFVRPLSRKTPENSVIFATYITAILSFVFSVTTVYANYYG